MRLIKALPVFCVLGAQTIALVAFAVNLSFTQTQQGKDIAEIKASVANVQTSVYANIGPSAVSSSKIQQLENQVAQILIRLDVARDELARLRSQRGTP